MIRKMAKSDVSYVADIHCEALPKDFLPQLGMSFLKSLYKCILDINVGFGLVYEENGQVIGAAVATEDAQRFYKNLFIKRFWVIIPKIIWSLLKNPFLIKHALETILFSKIENDDLSIKAELLLLVLRRAYQRRGIGTKILKVLNEEFTQRNIKSYVVRIYDSNTGANIFYKNIGFEWQRSYMMYGRKWNLYRYMINTR